MEGMDRVKAKMRTDFVCIADARRKSGEWAEADEKQIGAAIAAALQRGDANEVLLWAGWLADASAAIAAWEILSARAIAKMHEAAAREHHARKAEGGK